MRSKLITLHLLLATLLLPAALMFLITGALYTWEIKGEQTPTVHELTLASPVTDDFDALHGIVRTELARLQLSEPTGNPALRKQGEKLQLDWTGSTRDAQLETTAGTTTAKLTVKEASAYRRFVQLHKAKGGTVFKVYAATFAGSLLLILITGCMMAFQLPRFRTLATLSTGIGAVLFVLVAALS